MEWEKRTDKEKRLIAWIAQLFMFEAYSTRSVPAFLRSLADHVETKIKNADERGDPPCQCEGCQLKQKADAAKYN